MVFNKKNLKTYALFLVFGLLIGSLLWEVLERVLHQVGIGLTLTPEKALQVFDIYVLSMSVRANPGSLIGAIGGTIFFKLL
jgi:hypothetical protein